MEWQQLQTSAQHEVWSLIELRSISPRTTVAVQAYYRVTLQRVDACVDILKNLHAELWRMNNLPLELIHQCTTMENTFFGPHYISFGPGHFYWTLLQFFWRWLPFFWTCTPSCWTSSLPPARPGPFPNHTLFGQILQFLSSRVCIATFQTVGR